MRNTPFADSRSITAPLLIGTAADDTHARMVINTLVVTVPEMKLFRRVRLGHKTVSKPFTRSVYQSTDNERFYRLLQCYDIADDEQLKSFSVMHWAIGLRLLEPARYTEVVPAENTVIRADVTSYELKGGAVVAAPQLALIRHLLVESYRALDPSIAVAGGQHDWRPEWWPDAPPPDAS